MHKYTYVELTLQLSSELWWIIVVRIYYLDMSLQIYNTYTLARLTGVATYNEIHTQ